jgi:hypothetical protein
VLTTWQNYNKLKDIQYIRLIINFEGIIEFSEMAGRRRRILRLIGWILAGFILLVVLITAGFYLGRNRIMRRAVTYLNDRQPGEVQMGQINLIPFMDFPFAALQLRDLAYYEPPDSGSSVARDPILFLEELYVSLNIRELIKGNLAVSQVRMVDGFLEMELREDSISNLEKALGIRFGNKTEKESISENSTKQIDLRKVELKNILARYVDRISGDSAQFLIRELDSRFRYSEGEIRTGIELITDINSIKYQAINLQNKDDIRFNSQVIFDTDSGFLEIEPSSLSIAGLELETRGSYNMQEPGTLDVRFRATNTGLDVLNFLFLGILDLEEIEQIGQGTIEMEGSVIGSLAGQIPAISVKGTAHNLAFRIKSIHRDVTGINFDIRAGSGRRPDLSEGYVELRGFRAHSPEGSIIANLAASNLVRPDINLQMEGEADLAALDKILKTNPINEMRGRISLAADVKGILDLNSGTFLDDAGFLTARAEQAGFIIGGDTVSELNGEIYMEGNHTGVRNMNLVFNGNRAGVALDAENLIHYLLGFDRDVRVSLKFDSDRILPGRILKDTAVTAMLGNELNGLHFGARAMISKKELDRFLESDSLPSMSLTLDTLDLNLPLYSDISDLNASLTLGHDTLTVHYLEGQIGESGFRFSGELANQGALFSRDTSASVSLRYNLSSSLMRAEDLLVFRENFLLPEEYRTEYLADMHFSGSLGLPVAGLIDDSADLDFQVAVEDLGWQFRYYPLEFAGIHGLVRKQGKELIIDDLEGRIGESNIRLKALIGNPADSLGKDLYGNLELGADLLDFNELLSYNLPEELRESTTADTSGAKSTPHLDQIDYPDFSFSVDVGELRIGENRIGIRGSLKSTHEKILYLEQLEVSDDGGGTITMDGQFNVANPYFYNFSAKLNMQDVNIRDLPLEMQSGEETYRLDENFSGVVSADGLAEVFFTPDLKLDIPTTTAMFNVTISDGELINFTPLKAAGKYLDNKDLNHVRFSTLRNRFTLMDSKIIIPRMVVESTVGQLLIEGEQGLDGSYLYLVRIPTWLIKEAAVSRLTAAGDDGVEDEIRTMKLGKFMKLTTWSNGTNSEVRINDKRDKYR